MPATPPTNAAQAQTALDAATTIYNNIHGNQNATDATKEINLTDWAAQKAAIVNWLKANVGSGIDGALSNLQDVVISRASAARGVAVDYLQKTFDDLYRLTNDPTWQTQIADVVASQQHVTDKQNGLSGGNNQDYIPPSGGSSSGGGT